MNNALGSNQRSQNNTINPFARALAEARGGQQDTKLPQSPDALKNNADTTNQPIDWAEQQRQQAEQLKRERLRMQLHKQVNPVEQTDVFNAREQQVKKQIDDIRHELKLLVNEVQAFNQEIDISIMSNVGSPGQDGKYYITFFQKLRELIMLLRKKVHSARTWATTFNSKKKKRKKGAVGLDIAGKSYEQTATVYDRMHHERSTVYSGS
jgi:hypothetical protein